jgi:catechol 2,3-dioxygenase-like lactoylglutathione lyase family enzyme
MSSARPRVLGCSTCLIVSNLERSIAFYCDKLGFTEPAIWGDPPSFAMANRDGFDIMLMQSASPDGVRPNGPDGVWDLYLRVEDARDEAEALRAAGVQIDADLSETEYEMLEFEVLDPDGHRIGIGSELKS